MLTPWRRLCRREAMSEGPAGGRYPRTVEGRARRVHRVGNPAASPSWTIWTASSSRTSARRSRSTRNFPERVNTGSCRWWTPPT